MDCAQKQLMILSTYINYSRNYIMEMLGLELIYQTRNEIYRGIYNNKPAKDRRSPVEQAALVLPYLNLIMMKAMRC